MLLLQNTDCGNVNRVLWGPLDVIERFVYGVLGRMFDVGIRNKVRKSYFRKATFTLGYLGMIIYSSCYISRIFSYALSHISSDGVFYRYNMVGEYR